VVGLRGETQPVNRLSLERHVFVHGSGMEGPGRDKMREVKMREVMDGLVREEVVIPIIDGTPLYQMVEGSTSGSASASLLPRRGSGWGRRPTGRPAGR
jgi:hypothetical protein